MALCRRQGASGFARHAANIAATKGGNCGENATLALHYLAGLARGDTITKAGVAGVDHAFVLIGDFETEPLKDIVVVDAWVLHPQPLLYPDFVFAKERSQIRTFQQLKGHQQMGNETRQERRTITRQVRKALKGSAELTKKVSDIGSLGGIWEQPYSARYKFVYVLENGGAITLTRA